MAASKKNEKKIAGTKNNNRGHVSGPEKEAYSILEKLYPNLLHNYKSDEYPFICDFFDPDTNTYIELNIHWTHGGHWFDPNNEKDRKTLESWKKRAKTSQFYKKAVNVWTKKDLEKKKIAEENDLKFIVLWNVDDARKLLEKESKEKNEKNIDESFQHPIKKIHIKNLFEIFQQIE